MKSSPGPRSIILLVAVLAGLFLWLQEDRDHPASPAASPPTPAIAEAGDSASPGGSPPPEPEIVTAEDGSRNSLAPPDKTFSFRGASYPVREFREHRHGGNKEWSRTWLVDGPGDFGLLRIEQKVKLDAAGKELATSEYAYIAGEFLVSPAPGATPAEVEALLKSCGAESSKPIFGSPALLVSFPRPDLDTKQRVMDEFAKHPAVIRITEGNGLGSCGAVPNDPQFNGQYSLQNNTAPAAAPRGDIRMIPVWNFASTSPDVVVAVIDTGLDFAHSDLAPNAYLDTVEIPGNGIDEDGNGMVDDFRGWDFQNNDNNPADDNKHGTHVAGVIGAVGNNGSGIAGITWSVRMLPIKVFNSSGYGTDSTLISAINYARIKGAKIMSMSVANYSNSTLLSDAIQAAQDAGILMVIAAGNSGTSNNGTSGKSNDSLPNYPSSFSHANILAVANTNEGDYLDVTSNYGATQVDLAAPGTDIVSTVPGGGVLKLTGTSMATPHVAGVACLMAGLKPDITVAQMRSLILDHVDPVPQLAGKCVTGGRLNAEKSLLAMIEQFDMASGPRILTQPEPASVLSGETARFTTAVSGWPALSLRWQISSDGGVTWQDLEDLGSFAGVRSPTLEIRYAGIELNACLFRVAADNAVGDHAVGSPAMITVGQAAARAVAPGISPNGGTYPAGGVSVTLATPSSGAMIRYTLDGSDPSPSSDIYITNVPVTTAATLKARTFADALEPSAVSQAAFKIGSPTSSPIIVWGTSTSNVRNVPTAAWDAVAIACGNRFGVALRPDGTVTTWGITTNGARNVPAGLSGVVAIACAATGYHTLALKSDGTVVAWGWSDQGQANVPAGLSNVVAVAAGGHHSLALRGDGTVVSWGNVSAPPPGLKDVVAIACGTEHNVAVKNDGTVAVWGGTIADGIPPPPGLADVISVASGDQHVLALKRDGTVTGWGLITTFPINLPPADGFVAISAGGSHSVGIRGDGTMVTWRYTNDYDEGTMPRTFAGVDAVYASEYNVMVLRASAAPVEIFPQPAATIANGKTATLAPKLRGATRWQWFEGNSGDTRKPVPGGIWPWLTTAPLTESKIYWMQAWNGIGAVSTSSIPVNVLPPPSPLEIWRNQHFPAAQQADPAISGESADPDRDGLSNLLEYAFGLNPWAADAGMLPRAVLDEDQSYLRLSFTRRPDLTYTVQTSADLSDWSDDDPNLQLVTDGLQVSANYPSSAGPQTFMRIVVSSPSP